MGLVLKILFGRDMTNSLIVFALVTGLFSLTGFAIPHWSTSAVGLGITVLCGLLPDFDMVPYLLIRKGRFFALFILVSIGAIACQALAIRYNSAPFMCLGIIAGIWSVVPILNTDKIIDRASHWPAWHYPLPLLATVAAVVWMFASEFDPAHLGYYECLALIPLALHFVHDSIQPQGFPIFSLAQRMDRHYRVSGFAIERVPEKFVRQHYRDQWSRAYHHTGREDAERRADAITIFGALQFLVVALIALAIVRFI